MYDLVLLESLVISDPLDITVLTDQCHMRVADETLEDEEVIDIIHRIDRGVCVRVSNRIISKDASQTIMKAVTDTEALGILKEVTCKHNSRFKGSCLFCL